jgi:hypothetical protein
MAVPNRPDYSQRVYRSPAGLAYTILYSNNDDEVVLIAILPVPGGIYD